MKTTRLYRRHEPAIAGLGQCLGKALVLACGLTVGSNALALCRADTPATGYPTPPSTPDTSSSGQTAGGTDNGTDASGPADTTADTATGTDTGTNSGTDTGNDSTAITRNETNGSTDVRDLPLGAISDLNYAGGFTVPDDQFGDSSMNFSEGVIAASGDSLFAIGHVYDDAVAEFIMPDPVQAGSVADLPSTGAPVQNFSGLLNRPGLNNPQRLDTITGMIVADDKLIVNALVYYDATATVSNTTMVVNDAGNLTASGINGFLNLPGAARTAGWLAQLPADWQKELGKSHLVGNSSYLPIVSRHSVGPSFHAVNTQDIISARPGGGNIPTTRLMEFSLQNPLQEDLYNESRNNDMWTIAGGARFGFVIPGTRTYATFGWMAGTESGVGYKITQTNGNLCGGQCAYDARDVKNMYWLWDMNDLLAVRDGSRKPYDIKPYAYGEFNMPFQTGGNGHNGILGGSFDPARGRVYFTLDKANNTLGPNSTPPVVVAYDLNRR